jgi:lipid-A-disaccharide synthase
VVGYRGHPATALVARAIIRTQYFTLFNIAADEAIAPEFLQEHCNGAELAKAVAALLDDPAQRDAQVKAQTASLAKLGLNRSDPFEAAADVVIDLARSRGLLGG